MADLLLQQKGRLAASSGGAASAVQASQKGGVYAHLTRHWIPCRKVKSHFRLGRLKNPRWRH